MKHSIPTARSSALVLALALGLLLPALVRPTLAAETFSNTARIDFNDENSAGPAVAPGYPSTIAVSGLDGSIIGMTVTLSGLSHNLPDNLDILLVGPDGKQVMLMSDAGGIDVLQGVNLTFADGAAALPGGSQIASGTYRPSNYTPADSFPAPAPAPAGGANYPTSLAAFNLTDPNGEWRLFAMEDGSSSTGSIAGWSLSFETAELVAAIPDDPAAATVNAGSPLTYTVGVTNDGTEAVANPVVTIGIPAGTSYGAVSAPAGWSCPAPAAGAAAVTCTVPSFGPSSAFFDVTVLADKALAPGATLTRTLAISSEVDEANTANNSAQAVTTVTTLADLAVVAVTAPAAVNAGEELDTTVTVQNNGPSNAANARVSFPVPTNTSFSQLVSPEGWTCQLPAVGATGEAICTRPVFTTESATFKMHVVSDPGLDPGSVIGSSAAVSADTADSSGLNNSGADSTAVLALADLAVAVTDAPRPVSAAAKLTYTIDITNNGPSNADGAQLATAVVRGTTFVSVSAPAGWSCLTPPVGGIGSVTCSHPSFGVETDQIVLTVEVVSGVPEGAVLAHTSTVSTVTPERNGANDSVSVETPVTVAADLSVSIEGVGPAVRSGATLNYVVKVNNSGPEPADGVTLTTATPANTTFQSLAAPAGWVCSTPAVNGTGAIRCTNEGMEVTTDSFALAVKLGDVPNGTALSLSAAVAVATDKNPANNSARLDSQVAIASDLSLTVGGQTAPARPNATLTYELQLRNSGPENAPNAQVAVTLPARTTFVSLAAPAGWSCATPAVGSAGAVTCTHPSFGVQTATFTLAIKVDNVSDNLTLSLTATASSASQDLTPANNSGTLSTPIISRYRAYLPLTRR
jgi:uncharacterized repeat protein (TIGR01451 family)